MHPRGGHNKCRPSCRRISEFCSTARTRGSRETTKIKTAPVSASSFPFVLFHPQALDERWAQDFAQNLATSQFLICNQFSRGVFSMLGAVSPDSFDTLHSYSNTFQMPFVTPWFPEKVLTPSSGLLDFAISMRPDYHRAIIDTVRYYGWKKIIYLYDSHDGKSFTLRLSHAFLILQRIMDDRWESEVIEYGAINITGFRIVDATRPHVKDFLAGWHRLDPATSQGAGRESISAQAALMYDAVFVLVEAFNKFLRKRTDKNNMRRVTPVSNQPMNGTKALDCYHNRGWVTPWEHGDKISRLLRK
ncbi:hypothetical protein P5V15_006771, partial [Pogonomyrmex californicus]